MVLLVNENLKVALIMIKFKLIFFFFLMEHYQEIMFYCELAKLWLLD